MTTERTASQNPTSAPTSEPTQDVELDAEQALHIPDSLAASSFGQWGDSSYGPTLSGSGASKLGQSVVAPVVACARGYLTMTRDTVRDVMKANVISPQSTAGKQLVRGVGDMDALLMPWFAPEYVTEYWRNGFIVPSSVQYRPHPANVAVDPKTGKIRKYENLAGQQLVLGVHPATPPSWLTEAVPVVMLAEGALKGDSALTALLRANGISDAELSYQDGDEDPDTARRRLRTLLETRIPSGGVKGTDGRVLIITLVGVTTWRQNPEWNSLRLKATAVWVALDGDVGTNPNVWKQASDLFEHLRHRDAKPLLVDLSDVPTEDGHKVGIDDYFATGKNWRDMTSHLSLRLPDRPRRDDSGVDVRMDEQTRTFQKKVDGGPNQQSQWTTMAGMIARVTNIDQKRAVSPGEAATGIYDETAPLDPDGNRCQVEVSWFDPKDDAPKVGIVEGPIEIVSTQPSRWRDPRISADVPPEVHMIGDWPPSDPGFLKAMKLHRLEQTNTRSSWSHMGWVPVPGKSPVFIVGKQVIGVEGDDPSLASSAVTSAVLQNAELFGVVVCDDTSEVVDAARNVLETYFGCWSNRRDASTMLSLAMRPVVPIQSHLVACLTGHSGLGKSFSSAAIMAFWQPHPDIWGNRSLPGSASDTASDAEVSVSVTPIWVIDDQAPSSDPMAQARGQAKVNEIIRNVHNGGSKGRRRQDMSAQQKFTPRAVLVVSAESPPQEQSIINRIIHIQAQAGFLVPDREPTTRLLKMMSTSNDAAKITGYALTRMATMAAENGWKTVRDYWASNFEFVKDNLERKLKAANSDAGDPTRRSEVVADLAMGAMLLCFTIDELGLKAEFPNLMDQMMADMFSIADDGFNENRTVDVGEETVHRLRTLLGSGQAHIIGAGVAGPPVVVGPTGSKSKADQANQNLGWDLAASASQDSRPLGARIGVLLYDRVNNNEPVVIIDPRAALALIQQKWGHDGHSAASTWNAVWQAGKCYDRTWTRKKRNKGSQAADHVIRVMVDGNTFDGVPFSLASLANISEEGVNQLGCRTAPSVVSKNPLGSAA